MKTNKVTGKLLGAAMAAMMVTAPFANAAPILAEEIEVDFDDFDDFYFDEEFPDDYDWLDDYTTLSADEKKTVREVWDKIDKLYIEMDECYDEDGKVIDQKKLDKLEKKEGELWASLAEIDRKMVKEDIQNAKEEARNYVEEIEYLTKKEKEQYIEAIDNAYDAYEKSLDYIDDEGNITNQKKYDAAMEEMEEAFAITDELDIKILEAEIDDSENLTDKEKKKLKEAYAKLRDLYAEEDECFDEDGNVIDQDELDELYEKEGKILESIEEIEMKFYGWDESDF